MSLILIYTTYPNKEEAKKVVNTLLEKKLIACANFLTTESCFNWKGVRQEVNETVALLKTKEANWEKVKEEITKLHSYDTPCVIKIPAEANEGFEKWVERETE
jgi:periplasmic divalent cation tolerance protein